MPMHGGLLCITFCLSVNGQKILLDNNSYLQIYYKICDGDAFCFKWDEETLELAGGLTSTSSCIFFMYGNGCTEVCYPRQHVE